MERAAARANLPLKYSQGFNPRPRLSLAVPRPVGVASRCELLVLELAEPPIDASWTRQLAEALPAGVEVLRAEPLTGRKAPRISAVSYELAIGPAEAQRLHGRLESLNKQDRWEVLRQPKRSSRSAAVAGRAIDIKDRVRNIRIDAGRLRFTLESSPSGSARPAEVLALLAPGEPNAAPEAAPSAASEALVRLTRTDLDVTL